MIERLAIKGHRPNQRPLNIRIDAFEGKERDEWIRVDQMNFGAGKNKTQVAITTWVLCAF